MLANITGLNGHAMPEAASWLAVVVLVAYITMALGYGVVVVRKELQHQRKFNLA